MLQFIAEKNEDYSVAELTQMAIEAGCGWIQLHLPDADAAEIRALSDELIPMCKEAGVILTLEDRPDEAKELGIHGVHLTDNRHGSARKVREEMGPGAIIGVTVADPQAIISLKGADIDYVTLSPTLTADKCKQVIADARTGGSEMPIVVTGTDIDTLLSLGANGIAVPYAAIADSDDPVAAIADILAKTAIKE